MTFSIMEGLYACAKSKGFSSEDFLIESIGHGGDYKLVRQKAEVLLLRPDVAILVAFIDPFAAQQIEPFVNACGKILITAEMGADVPGLFIPSPLHIALSLQAAYGSVLGVQSAIRKNLRSFTFTSSLLDAGYTQVFAAWDQIEKSNGRINFHFTVPLDPKATDLCLLKEHVEQHPSEAIMLQFCAMGFNEFQNDYSAKELDTNLPAIAAPFLFERNWLASQKIIFKNVSGFVAWDKSIQSNQNESFQTEITNYCHKQADIFHLLGWEVGLVLDRVSIEKKKNASDSLQMVKQVVDQPINSPRGELKWNQKFRRWVSPMYEVKMVNNEGVCQPELTGLIVDEIDIYQKFAENCPVGQYSHWNNMYLCPT